MTLNICLVEPEIPQNTGNIARTCALTRAHLHLVEPLGFSTEDRYLKRAGLDYWDLVDVSYYPSFEEVYRVHQGANFYFATTKAQTRYGDVAYKEGDFLVFGPETRGLDEGLLSSGLGQAIRIPMLGIGRSLNLSNACNIVLFEALRQLDYPGLE